MEDPRGYHAPLFSLESRFATPSARMMNPLRFLSHGLRLAAAALLLTAAPASAQAISHSGHTAADHQLGAHFVVMAGPDGGVLCQEAEPAQAEALRPSRDAGLNLTVVPSTNVPSEITGLRILLRATDQLLEYPDALLAFRRAAARWERAITTPITVVLDVDYGPERFNSGPWGPNVLGSAYSAQVAYNGIGPAQIIAELKAQHPDDAQLQALYDGIPVPTPSTATNASGAFQNLGLAVMNYAQAQVFGYLPASPDPDPVANPFGDLPNIGFNSAFPYDFEPADGIAQGRTDFEGVAVHEMGHILGFTSIIGSGGPPNNFFSTWDLFRVRPEAVEPGEDLDDGEGWETAPRVTTPGPLNTDTLTIENGTVYYTPVQVFFDGEQELETSTATGGRQGGDGQQASHWRDDALRPPSLGGDRKIGIMDPNLGTGSRDEFNDNDLRVLEVIGFNVVYEPTFAAASFVVEGVPFDPPAQDSLVFIDLGDVDVNAETDLTVTIANESADATLNYEADVELVFSAPEGAEPSLALSSNASGAIAPEGSEDVAVTVSADAVGVFYGTLRIETNDEDALVVEVPFRFSVGGASAPTLALSDEDLGDLGDFADEEVSTTTFTITNEGSLDLEYSASVSLARRAIPFSTAPDAAARGVAALFSEDFEGGDLGDFEAGGAFPGDWQVITAGPAALEGHSPPNAAYFGQLLVGANEQDSLQYRNNASGLLLSPAIDVSAVEQQDLAVLTFNTYLQAEEGWDFASVLVTFDEGESYLQVATSDGGILRNTDAWEEITVELPVLSGYDGSFRFAFQFISDQAVTDIGWLIDDVVLDVREGGNPIYATPDGGTVAGGESETVTVTVNTSALDRGFYRGTVQLLSNALTFSDAGVPVGFTRDGERVLETSEEIPFTFTVGNPDYPTLAPTAAVEVTVGEGEMESAELEVVNGGDAALTFVRVLEPALSSFNDPDADGDGIPDATALAKFGEQEERGALRLTAELAGGAPQDALRSTLADGDSLASIVLPGAGLPIGIAQMADGRIVVADANNGGRTYVMDEDLTTVEAVLSGFAGQYQVGGLTYNENTGTLWFAILQTGGVYEATLGETSVTPTGRLFALPFAPVGLAYSPELDVFFVTEFQSNAVYAVDLNGEVLPGYPVGAPGRSNAIPGLSVTDGVIEIGGGNLNYLQLDQFARPYAESGSIAVSPSRLGGAGRINGLVRSKLDPNGMIYYLANPNGVGEVRVVAEDPADLPAYTENRISANEPMFGRGVESGATLELRVTVDAQGLTPGSYELNDELAFLTNNPDDRIVRVPVDLTVSGPTAGEEAAGLPTAFALHAGYPNPFADRATFGFDLPVAARASAAVYNVLGQRVATLLDGEALEAGRHEVTVNARGLASGTYLVRLTAGEFVGSKRITVVK